VSPTIVDPALKTLNTEVHDSLSLADEVGQFKEFRNARYRSIRKKRIYLIVEISFLHLFISFEHFLEQIFCFYLCGCKTSSGYLPSSRGIQAEGYDHALDIIRQEKPYVDWSRWSEIINIARICFEYGEPFATALGGSLAQLEEMRKIRNRIAHSSQTSERAFQDLIRQKLGYNPKGMTPGRFLLNKGSLPKHKTIIQEYGDLISILGRLIVH
jgi:hypothetical protein